MTFTLNDIQWVNQTVSGGRKTRVSGARITVQKNGANSDGNTRICNCLSISKDLLNKCRLRMGDKVLVGKASVDGKDYVIVRRSEIGHAISTASKNKADTGYVKFAYSTTGIKALPFPEDIGASADEVVAGELEFYWEVSE